MSSLGPGVTTWAFFAFANRFGVRFSGVSALRREHAAQTGRVKSPRERSAVAGRAAPAGEPLHGPRRRSRSAAKCRRGAGKWGRQPRCRTRPAGGATESWTTSQGRLRTRSDRSSVGAKPALRPKGADMRVSKDAPLRGHGQRSALAGGGAAVTSSRQGWEA